MEINTFDIVQVDFGNVEFTGEQGGIRPAVIIKLLSRLSIKRFCWFSKNKTK